MDNYIVPFHMEQIGIKKLMLINFEKKPDEIYQGLEWQYIDGGKEGHGYRLIAYRKDQYVDVYDEETVIKDENDKFEVCQNGLKNYRKVVFEKKEFKLTDGGIYAEFRFRDYLDRLVDFKVHEHSKRKTKMMDLLAPVGVSSITPATFPAFVMYQFDFVRRKHVDIALSINETNIELDHFPAPFPKDGQLRYFTRYSNECALVDFGKEKVETLRKIEVNQAGTLHQDGMSYTFEKQQDFFHLKKMEFEHAKHPFTLVFEHAFPNIEMMKEETVKDTFAIEMGPTMGEISGEYQVSRKENTVDITLTPTDGWKIKNKTVLTKILLSKKSVFCTWPKTYCYHQQIDLKTKESKCHWERINFEPKDKYI